MSIGMPEAIYLALTFMGVGLSLANHGKARKGQHNVFETLAVTAFVCGILYWGGFF